jgi:hypothetical protein
MLRPKGLLNSGEVMEKSPIHLEMGLFVWVRSSSSVGDSHFASFIRYRPN